MSKTGKAMVTAAVLMILTAGALLAQGPGGWGGQSGGPMMGPGGGQLAGFGMERLAQFRMMFRELDLTEEQQEEIRSIVEDAREQVEAILESARPVEDRETFMDIFTSPTLTVRDLEESMDQMDQVREDVRDIVLQAIVDVHDELTAEQLQELSEMAEEHAFGMEEGHGPMMGHDPGMRPDRW
ncbi:MAG: periplasmic heavy metal sensor [Candidatus Fermentibacteraceae bacterium]|nr:periplasmic heavy metal sensor [Candidatus Fermentibacteraceae bacterium]MBN2609166.1 periplasmic heavy metal sensor [Candidatus Fermentibacteraceae bacterium]